MQKPDSRKGSRRSSIMIVEKSGKKGEILKGEMKEKEEMKREEPIEEKGKENSEDKKADEHEPMVIKSDEEKNVANENKKADDENKKTDNETNNISDGDKNASNENLASLKDKEPDESIKMKDAVSPNTDRSSKKEPIVTEEEFHSAEEKIPQHNNEDVHSLDIDDEETHKGVKFDENKNEERAIEKDKNKSIPADEENKIISENIEAVNREKALENTLAPGEEATALPEGCDLAKLRAESGIVFEGAAYKQMSICWCFWSKKYFVITKKGEILMMSNKEGAGQIFVKTSDLIVVSRETKESGSHPQQIRLGMDGTTETMAFDFQDVRDAWAMKLSEVIRNNRNQ